MAAVGFADDRRPLSPTIRLAVHLAAATWAVWSFGGLSQFSLGGGLVTLRWVGDVLAILGIVWMLNLFNFMDGIDGIAASEAICISLGGGGSALVADSAAVTPVAVLSFGAACAGFLVWNWPRAKIFMGDVGSGYLGYVIAVFALAAARENAAAFFTWTILAGTFFVDATITLARRLVRGDRFYEAHRTHAYQHLARRWNSHERVTLLVVGLNIIWLVPWAFVATLYSSRAPLVSIVALGPLVVLVLLAGAGRTDKDLSRVRRH